MKLLMCGECADMIALTRGAVRSCRCGETAGQYLEDGLSAEATGPYIAFGMNSNELAYHARRAKNGIFPVPYSPDGYVEAWAMPRNPEHITRVEVFSEVEPE